MNGRGGAAGRWGRWSAVGLAVVGSGSIVAGVRAGPAARAVAPPEVVVRYPERRQRIAPDSNFVFGSVGHGGVELTIDGVSVPVHPEGGFLAWLAVPRPVADDTASYRIVAVSGPDTVRLAHPIRRPPTGPPAGAPRPWLDPDGLEPSVRWASPDDRIELDLVAERGATITAMVGDLRYEAAPEGEGRGTLARFTLALPAARVHEAACGAGRCVRGVPEPGGRLVDSPWAFAPVPVDTIPIQLTVASGGAARRVEMRLPLGLVPDGGGLAARLVEAEDRVNGRSGVVVGRPTPAGPYRWRFAPGSIAPVTGRVGDRLRLELGEGLETWVLAEDAEPVRVSGVARTRDARVGSAAGFRGVTLRVGLSRAVPTDVRQVGPRTVELVLYGTLGGLSRIGLGVGTGVTDIRWRQEAGPATRIEIDLAWPLWGYRLAWEQGDADAWEGPREGRPEALDDPVGPRVLRLDLRRPPPLDGRGLAGVVVAIDPGHPGGGSYGPTGLFEGDANLAVAGRLERMLRELGAEPVLVRRGAGPVGLYDRTRRAREADADLFVSIHNNALPDGIRPFDRAGTATYYYHAGAAPLARAVQRELVERLEIGDLGVLWGDLAVAREPWMPAILVEGAFMMIPAHEAALRTADFQARYAEGILEGIRTFLEGVDSGDGG